MAALVPTCPECGSIDMVVESTNILTQGENKAQCPNCGWEGPTRETVAAFFKDKDVVWSIERIGAVLLGVVTEYAAGPMVQVFEFAGMVEPDDMEGKGKIMRACVEAVTAAGFIQAHEVHVENLKKRVEAGEVSEDEMKLVSKALEQIEETRTPGEVAFDAYNAAREGKNYQGKETPPWTELPQGIRDAWEVAAAAVMS